MKFGVPGFPRRRPSPTPALLDLVPAAAHVFSRVMTSHMTSLYKSLEQEVGA